ncbi:uncharacterized membrane protein HdeD (DUF308 family) [Paenibacillus forsythiae]|uniref:Uncharacterized membrane protein HdeD (DUF308 family) n=1 Tax=Paenibacillus forsythiae TaxID=365616 RepID=A0ABU3HA84_9BACL|nr:hypothetical protein [Paenibacillus forsythiae]MDT3427738.1 uncharacterized membrane protein HdeD (DUF308 family) [Paenibacillus forsythiae]
MTLFLPAVYILCLGTFTFIQIRRLWSRNEKREAWIYLLSMTVSAAAGALLIAGVNVPTFILPYRLVFEAFGKSILSR